MFSKLFKQSNKKVQNNKTYEKRVLITSDTKNEDNQPTDRNPHALPSKNTESLLKNNLTNCVRFQKSRQESQFIEKISSVW